MLAKAPIYVTYHLQHVLCAVVLGKIYLSKCEPARCISACKGRAHKKFSFKVCRQLSIKKAVTNIWVTPFKAILLQQPASLLQSTAVLSMLCSWQEWLTEAEAVEEVQIMEELPHSLRREIAFNINKKIFHQLSIFTDFPVSQQAAICGMMTPLQV